MLISTFLSKAKAIVDTASNGEEGVQKALANDYNIVLMDIQMPVLDGYAAFQKLKAFGYNKPIIALTANALVEEKERAFQLGFSDYLTKPVNRQALVSAIADAVL
ncbi:MAG: response regulator [Bdellovibrionaceae bacterium]|nr:response regulator [Pseudobdellovibrionaceae bacterium]